MAFATLQYPTVSTPERRQNFPHIRLLPGPGINESFLYHIESHMLLYQEASEYPATTGRLYF